MFLLNRYVFGFLIATGLIILILVLVFSGPSTPKVTSKPLVSYATSNSSIEMDIYGPIVAPANHSQVDITINQYTSNITVYRGYNYDVVRSVSFNNSFNSYQALLAALSFAGYNKGTKNNTSSLGYCAVGDIYTFKLNNNGQNVSTYWTSNCGGDPVTYSGNVSRTLSLFESQVPNYSNIISGANI